jgi:hypothetical protein
MVTREEDVDGEEETSFTSSNSPLLSFMETHRLVFLAKIVPLIGENRTRYRDGEVRERLNASNFARCSKFCLRAILDGKTRRLDVKEVEEITTSEYLRLAIERRGLPLTAETFFKVVAGRAREKVVKALREEFRCPFDEMSTTAAASDEKKMAVLRYLVREGCPVAKEAMIVASRHRTIDCVSYLFSSVKDGRDLLDARCTENAAYIGNLDMMIYLRSIGCPWSSETSFRAAYRGHSHLFRWLCEKGCPVDHVECRRIAALFFARLGSPRGDGYGDILRQSEDFSRSDGAL